jgi:TolB-like protein
VDSGAGARHLAEGWMGVQGRKLAVNGVIADFGSETLRTASGHSVPLRPQAFAVLRYLAERAGQLATKDELIHALWPGLAVTDDSLVQCVHEIRRAFQDNGRVVLKTAPKRGYRLVLPDEAAGSGSWLGAVSAADGGPLAKHAKVSIAVLPFVSMSSDREHEYFTDGITEDLITDLSRWQTIAVASRNSTFRFKGRPIDIQTAKHELGVHFLVEGSVRRLGDRVRTSAQLIDAQTGNHVWAERYDRPMPDLFAMQDELVRTIAATLVRRVFVNTGERLRRSPQCNPSAYDLTMQADYLAWDRPSARAEAKCLFEQAIELDPGYGLPHSLLAILLSDDWRFGRAGSPEVLERAFALAKRGAELSDGESASHAALGFLHMERQHFGAALSHLERAVEINPANPVNTADLGIVLSRVGRAEQGLEHLRDARRTDPYLPSLYRPAPGVTQFVMRRYVEALAEFDRGEPTNAVVLATMAGCCAKLGLAERTRDSVKKCLAIQPEATIGELVRRALFAGARDREHFAECLRLAGMPE